MNMIKAHFVYVEILKGLIKQIILGRNGEQ